MPRRPRVAAGGYVYHALNRAVGRSTVFEKVDDDVNKRQTVTLADGPLRPGQKWLGYVSQAETEAELTELRRSAHGGTPFGETVWQQIGVLHVPRSST